MNKQYGVLVFHMCFSLCFCWVGGRHVFTFLVVFLLDFLLAFSCFTLFSYYVVLPFRFGAFRGRFMFSSFVSLFFPCWICFCLLLLFHLCVCVLFRFLDAFLFCICCFLDLPCFAFAFCRFYIWQNHQSWAKWLTSR